MLDDKYILVLRCTLGCFVANLHFVATYALFFGKLIIALNLGSVKKMSFCQPAEFIIKQLPHFVSQGLVLESDTCGLQQIHMDQPNRMDGGGF